MNRNQPKPPAKSIAIALSGQSSMPQVLSNVAGGSVQLQNEQQVIGQNATIVFTSQIPVQSKSLPKYFCKIPILR